MVKKLNVKGFDEYKKTVETFQANEQVNVYFSGSKGDDGISWCSDCVDAEPHVMSAVTDFAYKDSVFLYVDVGDRTYWKDMKNPFRLDKDTHISVIPTLIRWQSPQRLEGDQLTKRGLLEMYFTDGDD